MDMELNKRKRINAIFSNRLKLLDLIADRNPSKNNLYTPGSKIKIVSENVSRRKKPDYYFVLPWHFKKKY